MDQEYPRISAAAAAQCLGVSRSRVNCLFRQGRIPAVKVCGKWEVDLLELMKFKRMPEGWQRGRPRGPKNRMDVEDVA